MALYIKLRLRVLPKNIYGCRFEVIFYFVILEYGLGGKKMAM